MLRELGEDRLDGGVFRMLLDNEAKLLLECKPLLFVGLYYCLTNAY